MNRQMRRMLAKKGGIDMDSPEIQNLVEMGGGKLFSKIMKDKSLRKVMNIIKKNKDKEADMTCSHCEAQIHVKGILSQCPKCQRWILNKSATEDIQDEEVLAQLNEVIFILNEKNVK